MPRKTHPRKSQARKRTIPKVDWPPRPSLRFLRKVIKASEPKMGGPIAAAWRKALERTS